MKLRKKFDYNGIEIRIVVREESYMNSTETMEVMRVIAPNGGTIPVNCGRKQSLKSIQTDVVTFLDDMELDKVKEELTKRYHNFDIFFGL